MTIMHDIPNLIDLARDRLAQLEKAGLPSLVRDSNDTVRLRLLDGREVHFRMRPQDWQYHYRGASRAPGSERTVCSTRTAMSTSAACTSLTHAGI